MRTPLSSSGLVQLVIRRPRAGQPADSEFFTTWKTLEAAHWRSDLANGLLQVAPSEYFGLRCFVQEFEAMRPIQSASTIAHANPQFGPGGGEKLFIPRDEHAHSLRPVGDLILLEDVVVCPESTPPAALARIIDFELSLGNALVACTSVETPHPQLRYWMQEALHLDKVERSLEVPESVRYFEDEDIHGNAQGLITADRSAVVIAPWLRAHVS